MIEYHEEKPDPLDALLQVIRTQDEERAKLEEMSSVARKKSTAILNDRIALAKRLRALAEELDPGSRDDA